MIMALPEPDDVHHGPAGLVLCPTRELAIQVAEVLEPLAKAKGHTITAVYGGEKIEKQIKSIDDGTGIIVATPGRLIDLLQRGDVKLDEVKMVAVDEADRMADMGFLPQVEWVLRHVPDGHQTLLFSATLDGSVGALVDRYQTDPVTKEVVSETVTVEQMHHRFLRVHEMDKAKVAAAIVANGNRTLIFSNTKRAADRLAADLETARRHGRAHPRRPAPARPREGAQALLRGQAPGAGRLRRRRPRPRHRRDRHRRPLGPAARPQDLPPPLGPHRPGRHRRRRRDAAAVGRGDGGQAAAAASRSRGPPDRLDVLQRRATATT